MDRLVTRIAARAIAEHDGDEDYFRENASKAWPPVDPELEFTLAVGDPDLSAVFSALAIAETRPELVQIPVIRERLRDFIVRWAESTPAEIRKETFVTALRDYQRQQLSE
jgi:hypothetical protein